MTPAACPFCAIASGEVPAHVVLDNARTLAFLDHRPLFPGHTLLVPRAHHQTLTDLPEDLVEPLFADARLLARAIQSAMDAEGSFIALNNVVSQSVPHLHVHVVPRRRKDGLKGFFWPRQKYEGDEQMRDTAALIRQAVRALTPAGGPR